MTLSRTADGRGVSITDEDRRGKAGRQAKDRRSAGGEGPGQAGDPPRDHPAKLDENRVGGGHGKADRACRRARPRTSSGATRCREGSRETVRRPRATGRASPRRATRCRSSWPARPPRPAAPISAILRDEEPPSGRGPPVDEARIDVVAERVRDGDQRRAGPGERRRDRACRDQTRSPHRAVPRCPRRRAPRHRRKSRSAAPRRLARKPPRRLRAPSRRRRRAWSGRVGLRSKTHCRQVVDGRPDHPLQHSEPGKGRDRRRRDHDDEHDEKRPADRSARSADAGGRRAAAEHMRHRGDCRGEGDRDRQQIEPVRVWQRQDPAGAMSSAAYRRWRRVPRGPSRS